MWLVSLWITVAALLATFLVGLIAFVSPSAAGGRSARWMVALAVTFLFGAPLAAALRFFPDNLDNLATVEHGSVLSVLTGWTLIVPFVLPLLGLSFGRDGRLDMTAAGTREL
jgi:uncharacterized membrane protein